MTRRLLPLLLLAVLLTGVQQAAGPRVAAQATAPPLSPVAQSLMKYAIAQADLPVGVRLAGPPEEVSNEDVVVGDPNYAAIVRKHQRITEISQSATRTNPSVSISISIILFKDAAGAWGDTLDSTFPDGVEVEATEPGPAVGERSILFHYEAGSGENRREVYQLGFQRDRVELAVVAFGAPGTVSVEQIVPVARRLDAKILAAPPGPVSAAELALIEEPTPAVLVRGAVRRLLAVYVEPLRVDELLTEAWQGAARALEQAGVRDVPPPPVYPADDTEAIALHMKMFPTLEKLAQGRMEPRRLAYAAIAELVDRRNDCHTYFLTPEQWQTQTALNTGGLLPARIGVSFALETPMRVVYVAPGSPAKEAGLRRGQIVLAINGRSVEQMGITEARRLINPDEGALNTFRVQNPSGRVEEINVRPARFSLPALESEVLPGNVGLVRWYTFQSTAEQLTRLRQTLEDFEARGVQGWVIDLRDNPGGSAALRRAITSLFVQGGRIDGVITRGRPPIYTEANGDALPFQRPLVFLVGPNSASAAEILPAVLQARGRAVVVGEQTAGCIGSTIPNGLLDGSALYVTLFEYVLGPDDRRLNRIGVTPNIEVAPPTEAEEEVGVDPQLAAAVDVIRQMTGDPAINIPAPRPVTRRGVIVAF
jgi:carboxyl-terminal processing protease